MLEEILMLITRRLSYSILNFSALQLTMQRAAVSTWWIKQLQNGRNTGSSEKRQIVFSFQARQKIFSLSEKQVKRWNNFYFWFTTGRKWWHSSLNSWQLATQSSNPYADWIITETLLKNIWSMIVSGRFIWLVCTESGM